VSYQFCPKCGTNIGGKASCKHCGRMPVPYWPYRSPPKRGELKRLKQLHAAQIAKPIREDE
jgi:hypothetical protein